MQLASPGAVAQADPGELIDQHALAAYRRRLVQLDEDLTRADARADQAAGQRLEQERQALLTEVRAATGLGGRRRHHTSTQERARVAVRKAVAAALDRIELADAGLARHLRHTVRTGWMCGYEPDPEWPVSWRLH